MMDEDPLIPGPTSLRPEFRDRVRAKTSRLLRRRSPGRLLWGAAIAASLLIALATVRWMAPRRVEEPQVMRPVPPAGPKAPDAPIDLPAAKVVAAVAMEWKAFDSRTPERAKLYLAAGDRYAHDHQDLAAALRCYEQALDTGADAEVGPDDSWLVMALKLDRQKEK
jgi:hypothetical protein